MYTANHHPHHMDPPAAVHDRLRRANTTRDAVAGVLLILSVLLPWNVYFGITIAGTAGWVMGVLILTVLMSLAAVVLSHLGPLAISSPSAELKTLNRLRSTLTVPYLVVAAGFLVFAVVQSIRMGGSPAVPPGVGPGAWLGVAGALLAAAPVITGAADSDGRRDSAVRIIGIVSLVLAVAAVLFNLYWRTRFVVPEIGDADTGMQNFIVFVAAVLYGVVALLPVIIAARWLMAVNRAARLATVLLGAAVAVAGVFVWLLPIGRDLDAFHGIAQNTSTAGVGFEGYLAWVAAAAVVGTGTVLAALDGSSVAVWRAAARKALVLIAAWCGGSALLRIVDLLMSAALDLPAPPYNATALMAFDLVVAVVAMWLFVNSSGKAAPRLLLTLLSGVLLALTVCRVIVGVELVPRVQPLNPGDITDVYGNTLAQQITSTFDVALCVLALALLIIAFMTGNEAARKKPMRRNAAPARAGTEAVVPAHQPIQTATEAPDQWARPVAAPSDQSAPTAAIPSGQSAPTTAMAAGARDDAPATAKIFRPDSAQREAPATDRVAEVLAESTQRFAAGTTYGAGASGAPHGSRDDEAQ